MLELNLRFPISSILFLLIIGFFYFKTKRVKTFTTRAFTQMYITMLLNIFFEIATIISLELFKETPEIIRFIFHALFILSIDLLVFEFFIYIYRVFFKKNKISTKFTLISLIPTVVALTITIIFNVNGIEYFHDGRYAYSSGIIPATIFACIGLYAVVIIGITIVKRREISFNRLLIIWFALFFWIIGSLIQMIWPFLLTSSVAGTQLIFFLYLSIENPRVHFDVETDTFNRKALQITVEENYSNEVPFFYITIVCDELSTVKYRHGQEMYNRFITSFADRVNFLFENSQDVMVFHIWTNSFSVMINHPSDELSKYTSKLQALVEGAFTIENVSINFKPYVFSLKCPEYASTYYEISSMLEFCMLEETKTILANQRVIEIDSDFIEKKIAIS